VTASLLLPLIVKKQFQDAVFLTRRLCPLRSVCGWRREFWDYPYKKEITTPIKNTAKEWESYAEKYSKFRM
jgi:hypothetical protein